MAAQELARRVEPQQVGGDLADGLAHARSRAGPLLRAESGEARDVVGGRDVTRDAIDLLDRDVEPVVAVVVELEIVALLAADLATHDAGEAGNAVLRVYDEVAG